MSSSLRLGLWQKYMISREFTGGRMVPLAHILKLMVRKPPENYLRRMHPRSRVAINRRIKKPEPLKFKLQEYNPITNIKPLGNTDNLPFKIMRTFTNNLPIYTDYSRKHVIKKTVIRKVYGDLNELKNELAKITSNSEITIKTGKIVIKGLHVEPVKLYFERLGF